MAVTDDAVAPIRQFQVLPLGNEGVGFCNQRLRQHAAGALSGKLGQRIVDGIRLTERDDSAISRHGVSLLSGGAGRLDDTRLDTPPSFSRRHPNSRIAQFSVHTRMRRRRTEAGENLDALVTSDRIVEKSYSPR